MGCVCSNIPSEDNLTWFYETIPFCRAKILRVIDGDTVVAAIKHRGVYNKYRIRLYGINAPEMKPPKNAANRDEIIIAAKRSTAYLTDITLNRIKYCQITGCDNFGRLLAELYHDSKKRRSINQEMIDQGYAVVYKKN